MMRKGTFLLAALALAGCGKPAPLSADGAVVQLPVIAGRPGAAYFTLHGGTADATLIAVATPVARRAEMHETRGGAMTPLISVPVPAGAATAFARGGRHVMLFDIDPRLAPGKTAPLRLSFADGRTLDVQARVVSAVDPAP